MQTESYPGSSQTSGSSWPSQTEVWRTEVVLVCSTIRSWQIKGSSDSPRLFDREAVNAQDSAQSVLGTVHHVLLLLVVQLLLDDVLTQVEHHLQEHTAMDQKQVFTLESQLSSF